MDLYLDSLFFSVFAGLLGSGGSFGSKVMISLESRKTHMIEGSDGRIQGESSFFLNDSYSTGSDRKPNMKGHGAWR